MKKLTSIILLSIFFMIGCEDNNSILEPNNELSIESMPSDELTYRTKYSKTYTIDGSKGGRVSLSHYWKNEIGEPTHLSASIAIPKGAYIGIKTFSIIFDKENYSMELFPSPFTFDIPVKFDMHYINVDLTGFSANEFDFNYLDAEGEIIECTDKSVDIENGELHVIGAKLYHFSRYGWTRTGS